MIDNYRKTDDILTMELKQNMLSRKIVIFIILFSTICLLQGCFVLDWIFAVNMKAPVIVEEDCCEKSSKTKKFY